MAFENFVFSLVCVPLLSVVTSIYWLDCDIFYAIQRSTLKSKVRSFATIGNEPVDVAVHHASDLTVRLLMVIFMLVLTRERQSARRVGLGGVVGTTGAQVSTWSQNFQPRLWRRRRHFKGRTL